jgi:hypothetical protein
MTVAPIMPTASSSACASAISGTTVWKAADIQSIGTIADDQLDRPKAESLEHQKAVGHDPGHDHPGKQRHVEQQGKPDGTAEEFGEVGSHGGNLAHDPHPEHDRLRKMVAAHFRKVAAGDDAELSGERLEQHRDQVGEEYHPEQSVAVPGAGLDVGGEVPRVNIGDGGDDRRAGEHVRSDSDPLERPFTLAISADMMYLLQNVSSATHSREPIWRQHYKVQCWLHFDTISKVCSGFDRIPTEMMQGQ